MAGGWQQLGTKLANHNLEFRGNKTPALKSAVPEAISDLFNSCLAEGAVDLILPQRPLTYTALVTELINLGLIKPYSSSLSTKKEAPRAPFAVKSAAVLSAATPSVDEVENVLDEHRSEVKHFITQESLNAVDDSNHADESIPNVSEYVDVNTTNIELVGPTFDINLQIPENDLAPAAQNISASNPELNLQGSFDILREEHEKSKRYARQLETQMHQMNEKMLGLENQRATDNTIFLAALKEEIKTTMKEVLMDLKSSSCRTLKLSCEPNFRVLLIRSGWTLTL